MDKNYLQKLNTMNCKAVNIGILPMWFTNLFVFNRDNFKIKLKINL